MLEWMGHKGHEKLCILKRMHGLLEITLHGEGKRMLSIFLLFVF